MAFVSPRMSLKVWNAASDPYDHEQLADNFIKLDQHDHSQGRGTPIGGDGIQDGAITSVHIYPGSIGIDAIAEGSIDGDKLADGAVTADKLDPAALGIRLLSEGRTRAIEGLSGYQGFATIDMIDADGATDIDTFPRGTLIFTPISNARLAIGDLVPKLRLRVAAIANGVDPASILTFGFYPVNADGSGSNSLIPRNPTAGVQTPVSGSTVAVTPTDTVDPQGASAGFDVPVDGMYTFGVEFSAAVATNSVIHLYAALELYYEAP